MVSALAICVLLFFIRGLYLRILVLRHELIGSDHGRLVSLELWRKAMLFRCSDGTGTMKLPMPREGRTLLICFVGVPVRRHDEAIGLPNDAADRIDSVALHEFDGGFSPAFRAGSLPAPGRVTA